MSFTIAWAVNFKILIKTMGIEWDFKGKKNGALLGLTSNMAAAIRIFFWSSHVGRNRRDHASAAERRSRYFRKRGEIVSQDKEALLNARW